MNWRDLRYRLPLGRPPSIQRIATGVHEPNDGKRHFALPGHWYVHLYSYRAVIRINRQRFPIRSGYAGLIPPDSRVSHRYYARSTHLYAHFRAESEPSDGVEVPAMQDLGERFIPLTDRFYEAIRFFNTHPARAEARLWDILWELAQPARESDPQLESAPPAVQRACQMIEQYLSRQVGVPFFADHVDLSPTHLTRLFRKHLGTTVVAYIRQRRVLRARHLLLHSSLPIKTIAQQVGIPDPHLFNKTIRRELHAAPSLIRKNGSS